MIFHSCVNVYQRVNFLKIPSSMDMFHHVCLVCSSQARKGSFFWQRRRFAAPTFVGIPCAIASICHTKSQQECNMSVHTECIDHIRSLPCNVCVNKGGVRRTPPLLGQQTHPLTGQFVDDMLLQYSKSRLNSCWVLGCSISLNRSNPCNETQTLSNRGLEDYFPPKKSKEWVLKVGLLEDGMPILLLSSWYPPVIKHGQHGADYRRANPIVLSLFLVKSPLKYQSTRSPLVIYT